MKPRETPGNGWRWAAPSPACLAGLTWRLNPTRGTLEATWAPPDDR